MILNSSCSKKSGYRNHYKLLNEPYISAISYLLSRDIWQRENILFVSHLLLTVVFPLKGAFGEQSFSKINSLVVGCIFLLDLNYAKIRSECYQSRGK